MPTTPLPPPKLSALPAFPEAAWRGLFGDYRELMADVSECPDVYHYANLLSVVAAELGDRARLQEGKATYTNFFIFCCGATGTKKSTASDLIEEHVVALMPTAIHHAVTSVSSGEGLIRLLNDYPESLLLRYDEISDLFAVTNRAGQRIESLINKAFDLRMLETGVKRRADSQLAQNYCLNVLFNGTPDHVQLQLNEALFKGGLLNRLLVFAAEPTGKKKPEMGMPVAVDAREIAARIASVCSGWRNVQQARGGIRIRLSTDAKAVHAKWYDRYTSSMIGLNDLDAKPLTRLDTYAKKLAMVYCMLETTPQMSPAISADHMSAALEVLSYCQVSMLSVTRLWGGPKPLGQQADSLAEERVKAFLTDRGCSYEREIYRLLHLSGNECKRAVDSLASMGVVMVIVDRPRMVHFVASCKCFDPLKSKDTTVEDLLDT